MLLKYFTVTLLKDFTVMLPRSNLIPPWPCHSFGNPLQTKTMINMNIKTIITLQ